MPLGAELAVRMGLIRTLLFYCKQQRLRMLMSAVRVNQKHLDCGPEHLKLQKTLNHLKLRGAEESGGVSLWVQAGSHTSNL